MANPTRRELLGIFRNLTMERNADVVSDSLIIPHLQAGLEGFNDEVQYYVTDDTTSVTLVAETQEYDLPTDSVKIRWVRWNGRMMQETDLERLRARSVDWNAASSSEPEEYYVEGRKLGFFPKPSAAAVAAAAAVTIHQVATPADIAANASVSGLATMHRRIPVYLAVAEWYAGPGGNAEKSGAFLALFQVRAAAAKAAYAARDQQR